MPITTVTELINRISSDYDATYPYCASWSVTRQALFGTATGTVQSVRAGYVQTMPGSLPSGVTSFMPTYVAGEGSAAGTGHVLMVTELIKFGEITLATPTFTDGATMGTATELGATIDVASPVIAEVTVALNATPGSLQITYVDQAGNAAEANTAQALTASSPIGSTGVCHLNSGDWGVRDITTATRTGGTTPTGTLDLWGTKPICFMFNSSANTLSTNADLLTNGLVRRLGAGAKVGVFLLGTGIAASGYGGMIRFVGDD